MQRKVRQMQKEHVDLLCLLVEAARNVPKKEPFYAFEPPLGATSGEVLHNGIPGRTLPVYLGDVQDLASLGLITIRHLDTRGGFDFDVSPAGFGAYEQLRTETSERVEQVSETMRSFVESPLFRARYPSAFERWLAAEKALWSADTDARVTEIGHLCREAMQYFADALVAGVLNGDVDADPTHTVARVRSILNHRKPKPSERVVAFLDSLLSYWGCVHDLVQRQEHGALKEGEKLTWEDARRVVFQTLIIMYEVDRTVTTRM
jgi:hypothetical protein